MNVRTTVIVSALVGLALELFVAASSGRREAWDSAIFWTAGLPIAIVLSFAIGWLSAPRAWIGAAAVAPGQFMAMALRSGEIGSLWVLGLVLSVFLSLPFVAAAFAGSKLRPR